MAPKNSVDWQIRNLDTDQLLNPPYPVSDAGLRLGGVGGTVVSQQRFGFQDSITQWTAGKVSTFSFSTVLFAEHSEIEIFNQLVEFEALATKNEDLGRSPICVFSFGSQISETVIVENIDIEIEPPRSDKRVNATSDGTLRKVNMDFTLTKYKPFSQKQIDPTKPNKESYYLVVSTSEASYESLGRKFYGNALAGDRLRKRHPEMPMFPEVGSKISIPARSIILREIVQPDFHALDPDDEKSVESFEELLKKRNERKILL